MFAYNHVELKMMRGKTKLALVLVSLLFIALNFSSSTLFITLLLGLLFIPPLLLFASVFVEGAGAVLKGLRTLVESGKERFVISVSKESIVLEPNINR